eukprot:366577-Chlamydomonas_euryale.AAC.4
MCAGAEAASAAPAATAAAAAAPSAAAAVKATALAPAHFLARWISQRRGDAPRPLCVGVAASDGVPSIRRLTKTEPPKRRWGGICGARGPQQRQPQPRCDAAERRTPVRRASGPERCCRPALLPATPPPPPPPPSLI